MKLKYKNSDFQLLISDTTSNVGLRENDEWRMVTMKLHNDEFDYEVTRESITRKENIEGLEIIKKYYYENKKINEFRFIKNYFYLKFYDDEKKMELKLISVLHNKISSYSIFFVDEEIEEFIKILEASI